MKQGNKQTDSIAHKEEALLCDKVKIGLSLGDVVSASKGITKFSIPNFNLPPPVRIVSIMPPSLSGVCDGKGGSLNVVHPAERSVNIIKKKRLPRKLKKAIRKEINYDKW